MSAFASGFRMGGDMYDSSERIRLAKEQLEMEKAREARNAEEQNLRIAGVRRVNDATDALTNSQKFGIAVPENQEFNTGLQRQAFRQYEIADMNGGEAPQFVAPTGLKPAYRQATQMDTNSLMAALAAAKGDVATMSALEERRRGMQGDEETRAFIKRTQELAANRDKSPEAMDAWVNHIRPYTNMVSGYKGLDFDGRVDPKTGSLSVIPYGSNQLQPVTLEQALPYLLKSHQLLSEFGSPDAAIQALNTMSEAERTRRLADTNLRLGIADKVGASARGVYQNESGRITAEAAQKNADSAAGLRGAQVRSLNEMRENRNQAAKLIEEFDALSAEEQAGPKGIGLIRQFNMLNVKAGGQVSLAGTGGGGGKKGLLSAPVELKKNDDGTYTAFAKDGGRALYNTYNGEEIPLGMTVDQYSALKKTAQDNGVRLVSGEENNRLVLKFMGADGKFYDDPKKARYAEAPKAGAGDKKEDKPAPQPAERNPYVDSRGRPTGVRTPGDDRSKLNDAVDAVPDAVKKVDSAMNARAKTYLQSKIDEGKPLTPGERERAIRLGLQVPAK